MDNKIKNNRSFGRVTLKGGLNKFLGDLDLDKDAKNLFRASKVMNLYKNAIEDIYKNNAFMILEKTNAVYILNEKDKGQRRQALPTDKTIKKLVIYVCDSMVYADLDSRQEFIKIWFRKHGESIDKFQLLNSKLNMRRRFPFRADAERDRHIIQDYMKYENKLKRDLSPDKVEQLNKDIDKITNKKVKKSLKNYLNSI